MKKINRFFGRCAAAVCTAAVALSAFGINAYADNTDPFDPEYVFDPADLDFDSIGSTIEKIRKNDLSPDWGGGGASIAAAVFRGNEIMYEGYFGETDMENHIPADESSVYEWGSISKTMIWVSVMQLWEQGKLDLDADIRTYLPEGFLRYLSYDDPITVTNLMNHCGGWCESTYSIQTSNENDIPTLEEAIRSIEPAQVYRPGEVTSYSNWGAALAAYIVERVSGMDYTEYVHKNILEPLGMEHTAVSANHRDNEWVRAQREKLKSYEYKTFPEEKYKLLGSRMAYIKLYPAGSATGTLGDLAKYAMAFVDDSAPLFQSKETQEKLFSGAMDISMFSCGFYATDYTVRTFGHSGATFSGVSNMLFDRDSKVGLVILTNEPAGNYVYSTLPSLIFESFRERIKYMSMLSDGGNVTLDGYYEMSRANNAGLIKFYSFLNTVPGDALTNIYRIDGKLYQIDKFGTALPLVEMTYRDGGTGIVVGSATIIREKLYIPKLCVLTAYFMTAAGAFFILLVKLKMKKAGKLRGYTGIGIITAGQAAKVVSVIFLMVSASFFFVEDNYGLTKAAGVTAGIAQIICIALYAAAAVVSVYALAAKKPNRLGKLRYGLNIVCNAAAVFAAVCFEMYKFWGC